MAITSPGSTGGNGMSRISTSPDSQNLPARVTVSPDGSQHSIGHHCLVASVVEGRPYVVAHAAVHGDVFAHRWYLLDGTDGIQRHAGTSHDGPSGLDDQPGLTEAQAGAASPHRGGYDLRVVADGRGWLGQHVADGEASAGAELLQLEPLAFELGGEGQHGVYCDGVRLQLEDGRAQVGSATP